MTRSASPRACGVPECDGTVEARGWCSRHYQRWRKSGVEPSPAQFKSRATHCKRGHEFTPENTYEWRTHRHCLACNADRQRRYRRAYPERYRAHSQAYRARNPEVVREQMREWRSRPEVKARLRTQSIGRYQRYRDTIMRWRWGDPELAKTAQLLHQLRTEVRNRV